MPLRVNRALALGGMLGFLLGLLVLIYTIPGRPYSVVNDGDQGLSRLVNEFRASWITSLNDLTRESAERVLLVLARTGELSPSEVDAITSFLDAGGYVLAYGHQDFLKSLVDHLGLDVNFTGRVIDPVFNVGSRFYIVANSSLCSGESSIVVYSPLAITRPTRSIVVAWSSSLSFIDLNGNGYYDMIEPMGSFPVAVEIEYQRGRLIVVFTELLLENSVIDHNRDLVECISAGRQIVVDQSEVRNNLIEYSRLEIHGHRGAVYTAILIAVLLLVAYYVLQSK